MIIERLIDYLEERADERNRRPRRITGWAVGKCPRLLWYMYHEIPVDDVKSSFRGLGVFELGDAIEDILVKHMEDSVPGFYRVRGRAQKRSLWFDLGPDTNSFERFKPTERRLEITSRPDGIMFSDKGEVEAVVEVKSMSARSFDRARMGIFPSDYRAQIEVEMRAWGAPCAAIVLYKKDTSDLFELSVERSDAVFAELSERLRLATEQEAPDRPYQIKDECPGIADGTCVDGRTPKLGRPHTMCGGTGRNPLGEVLPTFPCGYCSHKQTCWGPLEMVTSPDGRPYWRLKP